MPANADEPKVNAADVAKVLRRVILPDDEDAGESVAIIAERADTSTRTVYRVLRAGDSPLSLSLADRLLVAAGGHISECELIFPDGRRETAADQLEWLYG